MTQITGSRFRILNSLVPERCSINSLAPGGLDYNLKLVNFKLISMINILRIFCEIVVRWIPQHLTDHRSMLAQVMAWCRQATSHYLSQCWPGSLSPNDVTSPQWVNFKNTIFKLQTIPEHFHIDGLVQERRNSSALALELRLVLTQLY